MNLLQTLRQAYIPPVPSCLRDSLSVKALHYSAHSYSTPLQQAFPFLSAGEPQAPSHPSQAPLRIGVVFSGGQAPGGHNVIAGLFDALKKLNPESVLLGFLNGPSGILEGSFIPITHQNLDPYRNMGGFDLLGSGRTKIETLDQFVAAEKTVRRLTLDGLVVIGGDDSSTNAAFLAEYFLKIDCKTKVIAVPKTIDGDLKNASIEISFGFDTASKVYSASIGNLEKDALSARKYYFFVKLMGRSASHLTLECALATHPNLTFISEEVAAQQKTLKDIVCEIADLICSRANQGKDYGVILIPEGLLEFIPEMNTALQELNLNLAKEGLMADEREKHLQPKEKLALLEPKLTQTTRECLSLLPERILAQLFLDRDPHGNVQVSKIDTESLLIDLVTKELSKRKNEETYRGKFNPQPIFCGYEGRAAYPSNFDCAYCYALGQVAALLVASGRTGLMATVGNLKAPVANWSIAGIPLIAMMHQEVRGNKAKWVIKKSLVDLDGPLFKKFAKERIEWMLQDDYISPGPIQFYGPSEIVDRVSFTLTV